MKRPRIFFSRHTRLFVRPDMSHHYTFILEKELESDDDRYLNYR